MKAYDVIDLVQGTDEWLAWRDLGVTATDSIVLQGVSPYKSRWRLWAEKTGYCRPVDLSKNPNVIKGVKFEDAARQAAEIQMDDFLIPICVQSKRWGWLRASLDGVNSNGEPVELKNPSQKVWDQIQQEGVNNEHYKMYRVQVLHQMLALEAMTGWLLFHNNGELITFEINADREAMNSILKESLEFYQQVTQNIEPDKDELEDWYIPEGEDAERWIALSSAYRNMNAQAAEFKEKIALLEQRQKEVSKELQTMMGSFRSADYGGVQITRYVVRNTDYKQMLKDSVITEQQVEQYTRESERCRVTVNHLDVMPKYVKNAEACEPLSGLDKESKAGFYVMQ